MNSFVFVLDHYPLKRLVDKVFGLLLLENVFCMKCHCHEYCPSTSAISATWFYCQFPTRITAVTSWGSRRGFPIAALAQLGDSSTNSTLRCCVPASSSAERLYVFVLGILAMAIESSGWSYLLLWLCRRGKPQTCCQLNAKCRGLWLFIFKCRYPQNPHTMRQMVPALIQKTGNHTYESAMRPTEHPSHA